MTAVGSVMRREAHVAAAVLAGVALLACGSVARTPVHQPALSLHDRPLRLPAVGQGAACPTSPQVRVPPGPGGYYQKAIPGYAFGSGPAYLSGQITWYAGEPGQTTDVLLDGTYTGPILVRIRRLDGGGAATFGNLDIPPTHRPPGALPPGTVTADGTEADVPTGTKGWSAWEGRLVLETPGCYGLQVDGSSFTSVVVFAVRSGPPISGP
jgi:hypothetical protein